MSVINLVNGHSSKQDIVSIISDLDSNFVKTREISLAVTKLEEALFWISMHEELDND